MQCKTLWLQWDYLSGCTLKHFVFNLCRPLRYPQYPKFIFLMFYMIIYYQYYYRIYGGVDAGCGQRISVSWFSSGLFTLTKVLLTWHSLHYDICVSLLALQITMTTVWLLLLLLIVSSQSVDSQSTTDDETCGESGLLSEDAERILGNQLQLRHQRQMIVDNERQILQQNQTLQVLQQQLQQILLTLQQYQTNITRIGKFLFSRTFVSGSFSSSSLSWQCRSTDSLANPSTDCLQLHVLLRGRPILSDNLQKYCQSSISLAFLWVFCHVRVHTVTPHRATGLRIPKSPTVKCQCQCQWHWHRHLPVGDFGIMSKNIYRRRRVSESSNRRRRQQKKMLHRVVCSREQFSFYRAMRYSAKRGIEIACRPSVCPSVCNVGISGPHRFEILETNCTAN